MTPSDLSSLINTEAHKILADRQLDVTVLPEQVVVERPRNPEHGDYATNLALQIAKKVGMNPRELASLLVDALSAHDEIATVDIAGPGFINIRLAAAAQGQIVADILAAGTTYGHNSLYSGERINLEFVSANPTGPVHLGSTRWAAVGDSLGRILAACGADVTRECRRQRPTRPRRRLRWGLHLRNCRQYRGSRTRGAPAIRTRHARNFSRPRC